MAVADSRIEFVNNSIPPLLNQLDLYGNEEKSRERSAGSSLEICTPTAEADLRQVSIVIRPLHLAYARKEIIRRL